MVNKDFLNKMKKDGVLINTARGNVINDADLLEHLNATKEFWYGADVMNGEPSAKKADFVNAVAQHPRSYVTHHCGAQTKQAEAAIGVEASRVLKKFKSMSVVDNQVNKAGFQLSSQRTSASALQSAALFQRMAPLLATEGEKFVKDIGAVFHFHILLKKGSKPVSFTFDLKNDKGSFSEGCVGKADAEFTMLDQDIMDIANDKLNPQMAFIQGKMKIKGNMSKAMKFTPDLLPKDAKL